QRLDADQAAQPAPVFGAVAARRQVDRFDQIGVDGRAQAADVIQGRDVDAVDDHAGLARGAAPDDELPRPEGRAPHARQVLHHLEGVALRAGDAARLFRADGGLDGFLLDSGGADDYFLIDAGLFFLDEVFERFLFGLDDGFLGVDRDQILALDRHF